MPRLPSLFVSKLIGTEFYPPHPGDLADVPSICIGSKSAGLGDSLVLSPLPRKLKAKYPHLKIRIYSLGMNPTVFWNNPYIDSVKFAPRRLFGDDTNSGTGHWIQAKEQFWGLEVDKDPRPEIYLTSPEKDQAQRFTEEINSVKPLLLLHTAGYTRSHVLEHAQWEAISAELGRKYAVIHIGSEGDQIIRAAVKSIFFSRRRARDARSLFAIMSQAKAFVGVDSGPMHVARAFQVPSVILLDHIEMDTALVFQNRQKGPYFLYGNHQTAFLYEKNTNMTVKGKKFDQIIESILRGLSQK